MYKQSLLTDYENQLQEANGFSGAYIFLGWKEMEFGKCHIQPCSLVSTYSFSIPYIYIYI